MNSNFAGFGLSDLISDKKSAASQPKKKSSARRHKGPLSNGKVVNGVAHLTNGSHSLNGVHAPGGPAGETLLNGHHVGKENKIIVFLNCPVLFGLSLSMSSVHHVIRSSAQLHHHAPNLFNGVNKCSSRSGTPSPRLSECCGHPHVTLLITLQF